MDAFNYNWKLIEVLNFKIFQLVCVCVRVSLCHTFIYSLTHTHTHIDSQTGKHSTNISVFLGR